MVMGTMKKAASVLAVIAVAVVSAQIDNFKCPDEFEGFYPHLYSCDKYWHCLNGKATEKLCGNGLGFDDIDPTYTSENCAELSNVDCGNRSQLEPPISVPHCPRLYGTFADEEDCTAFYTCRDGVSNRYSCAPGLAFDPRDRVCKWADQVTSCKRLSDQDDALNSFTCPKDSPAGVFTKHPHPEDCRQYFVCISSTPREYGCPLGTVFQVAGNNDGKCADPADVPECSNYYGELQFDKQDLVRAGVDPEAVGAHVPGPSRARVVSARPTSSPRSRPAPINANVEDDDQSFDLELRTQDLRPIPERPVADTRARPKTRPLASVTVEPATKDSFSPLVSNNRLTGRPRVTSAPTQETSFFGGSPSPSPGPSPVTTTSTFAPLTTTTAATLPPLVSFEPIIIPDRAAPSVAAPFSPAPLSATASPTTRATSGPVTLSSLDVSPAELPAATGERKPAKVKAGDDYYYYYYYYDDENGDKANNSSEAVPDST